MPEQPKKPEAKQPGRNNGNKEEPIQQPDSDATLFEPASGPGFEDATILETGDSVPGGHRTPAAGVEASDSQPRHPGTIAHFKIIKTLGEGGMGAVYLASQSEPVARKVALKLVHASLRSPEALVRFTAERQAMARLSHPNIAALYEAGATDDGFPYFAMEFVPGDELTTYCDRNELSIKARLKLFIQICGGVLHAHQKGILHRDLKPANLLVAEVDNEAIPKIIDFGIAKAIDEPLTAAAELTGMRAIGTPAYMSPEALEGGADIDTRTDVFSLGVVLFELLTGGRPNQPQRMMSGNMPPAASGLTKKPSTCLEGMDPERAAIIAQRRGHTRTGLLGRIRGDLDWIIMKAIADEPDRRYASAAVLAEDLDRYLNNEPVLARPPSTRYRVGKFVRRNRIAVVGASLVVVALILGIIGTTTGLIQAQQEAERADNEAVAARQVSGFLTELFVVNDPGEARGNTITVRELLDRGATRISAELATQPLLQARLMRTMGDVYENLGLYDSAAELDETALSIREDNLGREHLDVAETLNALGSVYSLQARYEQAEIIQQRALAIKEQQLGPAHPEVADSLNSLASVKTLLGQTAEAEILYLRALDIRIESLGARHIDTAETMVHLGWLMGEDGRYEEAEQLLTGALAIREQEWGKDHFKLAEVYDLLASVHRNQGQYEEAEAMMLQSLSILEKVLEPDHPRIGEALVSLGKLYRAQANYDEAEIILQDAIKVLEAALGAEHFDVAIVLGELFFVYYMDSRWQEAETVIRRQLQIYEKTLGPDHALVGETLNNLGVILSDELGRYPEGEQVLLRAVDLFSTGESANDYWNALSRWSLANNLRDQRRHTEAEPYFMQAIEILESTGGSSRVDNPDLPQLIDDYAKSLRAVGREDDATALEARFSD